MKPTNIGYLFLFFCFLSFSQDREQIADFVRNHGKLPETMLMESPKILEHLVILASRNDIVGHNADRCIAQLTRVHPDAIKQIMPLLFDKNKSYRIYAKAAMRHLAKQAVPEIVSALKQEKIDRQRQYLALLAEMRKEASNAVPTLISLAQKENRLLKEIIATLGMIGDKRCLPLLKSSLKSQDKDIQIYSIMALDQLGEATQLIPDIILFLSDKNPAARNKARQTLIHAGKAALPQLISLLQSNDPYLLREVLTILGEMGKIAQPAGPHIWNLLLSKKNNQALCIKTLARIHFFELSAAKQFFTFLENANPLIREEALQALLLFPPSPALSVFIGKKLYSPNLYVKITAISLQAKFHPDSRLTHEILLSHLESPSPIIRKQAIFIVANLARKGLPVIEQALASKKEQLRYNALVSIFSMEKNIIFEALPYLVKSLKDPSDPVKIAAMASLYKLDKAAHPAIPILIETLQNKNLLVRKQAALILAKMPSGLSPFRQKLKFVYNSEKEEQIKQILSFILSKIAQ